MKNSGLETKEISFLILQRLQAKMRVHVGGQRQNPGLLTPEKTKLEVTAALLASSTSRGVNEREVKKILWGSRRKQEDQRGKALRSQILA